MSIGFRHLAHKDMLLTFMTYTRIIQKGSWKSRITNVILVLKILNFVKTPYTLKIMCFSRCK